MSRMENPEVNPYQSPTGQVPAGQEAPPPPYLQQKLWTLVRFVSEHQAAYESRSKDRVQKVKEKIEAELQDVVGQLGEAGIKGLVELGRKEQEEEFERYKAAYEPSGWRKFFGSSETVSMRNTPHGRRIDQIEEVLIWIQIWQKERKAT